MKKPLEPHLRRVDARLTLPRWLKEEFDKVRTKKTLDELVIAYLQSLEESKK